MYQLHVPNMTCGHCVGRVTKALQTADDHARVQVDLSSKTVSVESAVSDTTLRKALSDAGYPVH